MELENEEKFTSTLVIDYIDKIEGLFGKTPDKRKKKEYTEWRDNLNNLIKECNKLAKNNIYSKIK